MLNLKEVANLEAKIEKAKAGVQFMLDNLKAGAQPIGAERFRPKLYLRDGDKMVILKQRPVISFSSHINATAYAMGEIDRIVDAKIQEINDMEVELMIMEGMER